MTQKNTDIVNIILDALKNTSNEIPIGISNRHIHLSEVDLHKLFGAGCSLTKIKDLSQPGQYACKETVIICGQGGAIENVRVLGPVRPATQLEILSGDSFKLGLRNIPVLTSGKTSEAPGGITLIGPKGSVQMQDGVMVAQRHIHMTKADAQRLQVHDGQVVSIQITGVRGGILHNTIVRAADDMSLECHLDIEEANAMGINSKSQVIII